VLLGDEKDLKTYLKAVCIDREVSDMEEGEDTLIGNGGVRLSGGQAQRVALARTLCHKKPLLVLDDPFSALDKSTEKEVFANVRAMTRDSIVLLLSHRLYLFPQMDQIIWMDEGKTTVGTHEELLQKVSAYATLFTTQEGEDSHEA
nr:ABC transporter ATP-binding protein [Ruminococcus sp.]